MAETPTATTLEAAQQPNSLEDLLQQKCPEVVELAQLAISDIVYHLNGGPDDQAEMEAVFIYGQPGVAPGANPLINKFKRIIRRELSGSAPLAVTTNHTVRFSPLAEALLRRQFDTKDEPLLADMISALWDDPSCEGHNGLPSFISAQAEILEACANFIEYQGGAQATIRSTLGAAAVSSRREPTVTQINSTAGLELAAVRQQADMAADYVLSGKEPLPADLSKASIKVALKSISGSDELEDEAVQVRFMELNRLLTGRPDIKTSRKYENKLSPPPTWKKGAACMSADPEIFFPEAGGSTRSAKRLCFGCPLKSDCLEYAVENGERYGVWGGLSERERRHLKRRQAG